MSACESCGDKTYRELLDDNVRVRKERDEARAEVERLQAEVRRVWREYLEATARITRMRYAYQRGAEAMREAIAERFDRLFAGDRFHDDLPDHVRATPIPEDK